MAQRRSVAGRQRALDDFAIVTAQTGLRTLLIDADLRRPSVHKAFQLQSPVGLSSYLAERINDLGIECGHFAFGAGVLFEAWEKGLVGPADTDGLRLEWGNLEAIDKLLDMTARQVRAGNVAARSRLPMYGAATGVMLLLVIIFAVVTFH